MSIGYNPSISNAGLLLLVDAGNPRSYSGSGTAWRDATGNGNDATIVGSPTFTSDGARSYFKFSNSSSPATQYAVFSKNSYGLGIRQNATFAGWIKQYNTSGNYLVSDWNGVGITVRTNSDTSSDFYVYPNNHRITVTQTFADQTWYNFACVMDGANMYTYINGVLAGSQTLGEDVGNSSNNLTIGARGDLLGYGTEQGVSYLAVYSYALTATQILQNFNALRTRYNV